ncbi:putative molybdenum-transport integral membrane protein ABC transporter ModB [Mycobacterium xenopi 4042]|uniref:Putative molybdenum-transport integral membrane protein ABC transporter ModB n=1 Tax=Mycobacterium xenopi 4042 TaxID=1299334 RepID=X8BFC0_MYCXE|nr:putative molybdenum-transport integral membrane protein ABC transporter ModB [Mycobacterium xenopi 4042]
MYVPAGAGMAFVASPLVAIAVKVDWPHFWSLITSPSSKTALLLSVKTATASTALCILFGVPMALVLAAARRRWCGCCGPWCCCRWCCHRWSVVSRCCTRSAGSG